MAKPTFRDRFYTRPVARALTSPLGIVLAGAGVAAGIVVGLPIAAAVGIGAIAYGARVAVAIPKARHELGGINPFVLDEPWRTFVWQAKRAQRQFTESVHRTQEGPLRERLQEISDRIDTGVEECWRVAQSGQALTEARAQIDITTIMKDLSQIPSGASLEANPSLQQTAQALQSQLDTAKRMDEIITNTRDRLRLLDARLGELVTRVLELSVRPQGVDDLSALGADVDSIVGEMEALRQALDETDNASAGGGNAHAGATSPAALPSPTVDPLLSQIDRVDPSPPQAAPIPNETAQTQPPQPPQAEPGGTPSPGTA